MASPKAAQRPVGPAAAVRRPPWTDVLASIEVGLVVLDGGGRIADLNPAAEALLGVSTAQARGTDVATVFGGESGNGWIAELVRGTLASGGTRRRSEGALHGRGGEVPVSATCAPVHGEETGLRGAVLILHDLTLQRTLDAATNRADRLAALGTVAEGLAHEIRNPLGGIKGAAQLLRGQLDTPEAARCTDIIIREVERLDGLVEHLAALSAPPRLQLEPVNIHEILDAVLALRRTAPEWGAIRLRVEFDPSLPDVRGDRAQLTQVFLNLVKNAVEALAGEGDIFVATHIETRFHIRRTAGRGQFLAVVLEDSGPGIPEEHQAHLFAPFFTTKPRGTGLGLALCNRIITQHGGTIAYEPGHRRGARFRVTLPVTSDGDCR